jgi:hypothetical protein
MYLQFKDEYLTPSNAIETTEKVFEDYFVTLLPNKKHRRELFKEYQTFIQAFSAQITPNFEVWIGGSFTTKKEFPNDIDLVIFEDYKVFQQKEKEFDALKLNYKEGISRLDIYKVLIYPEDHRDVFLYESKKIEWLNWFGHSRRNRRTSKRISRGFIKIPYHE